MGNESVSPTAAFTETYCAIHGPLVLLICCFGIGANLVNVLVLTRRSMAHSPTNILLSGLATAQLFLLGNVLFFTGYSLSMEDGSCSSETTQFGWVMYLLLSANLNVVFHTVALMHTLLVASFRLVAIHFPTRRCLTVSVAKRAVLLTFVGVPFLCLPFYFNSEVVQRNSSDSNSTADSVYVLKYRTAIPGLVVFNFWFFAIVCKILPCLILSVLSALLIRDLKKVEARRRSLLSESRRTSIVGEQNRFTTTLVLLVIVFLFISVELPQGVLNILSAVLSSRFRRQIYGELGNFFEMLTVLYSSVNFLLYCIMSSQFRETFRRLLRTKKQTIRRRSAELSVRWRERMSSLRKSASDQRSTEDERESCILSIRFDTSAV